MSRYFGKLRMSWKRVLLFAVVTGVLTGVIALIPQIKGTSLSDIAVNIECWILFAVFIILNCQKWYEASAKCFVFFLLSQPLVYLVQVPFSSMGWGLFMYYKRWFIITLLTLPGAAVAFLLKKQNALSVAVLSVANFLLAYSAGMYFSGFFFTFPHHLVSFLFCLALGTFMSLAFFREKKTRIAALVIFAIELAAAFVYSLR